MISLTLLIKLLASTKPAGFEADWFKSAEGAAAYAKRAMGGIPLPACWVIRSSETSTHAGERAEDVALQFDVVIAITNERSHQLGEMDDALLRYRQAVKDVLLGYELDGAARPIRYNGGQVIEYTDGDLYWRDSYSFVARVDNYLPDPVRTFQELRPVTA